MDKLHKNQLLRSNFVPIFLLVSILLLLFARSWLPGWTLASGDAKVSDAAAHYRFLPFGYLVRWATSSGLGNHAGHIALTPGNLLAHVVPFNKFFDANYIFHLAVLGLLSYYLLWDLTRNRFASSLGAFWMMLQPHVVSHILPGHVGHLQMIAWIPGAFLFVRRGVRTRRIPDWALAGCFYGLTVSTGTFDVAAFFGIVLAGYAVLLLVLSFFHRKATPSPQPQPLWKLVAGIVLAAAIFGLISYQALGVSLVHQLKVHDATEDIAKKAGIEKTDKRDWFWATQWSIPPEETLDIAVPGLFGWGSSNPTNPYRGRIGQTEGYEEHRRGLPNLNDVSQYLGAVMLLACLAALVLRGKNPQVMFFAVCAVVALLLSYGKFAPFYRLFFLIPRMDTLRNPIKWFYVTSFAVGMLGTMGIVALDTRSHRKRLPPRLFAGALVAVPAVLVVVLSYLTIVFKKATGALFWQKAEHIALSQHSVAVAVLFWLLAGVGFFLWLTTSSEGSRWKLLTAKALIVVALVSEILFVDSHYLPYKRSEPLMNGGPLAEFMNNQEMPFRIRFLRQDGVHGYIKQNYVGLYGWEHADPPVARRITEFHRLLMAMQRNPKRLLQLSNVRFVISPAPINTSFLKTVLNLRAGNTPVIVYQFTEELPRYFLVPKWRVVQGSDEHYRIMTEPRFKPRQEVLIDSDPTTTPGPPAQAASRLSCKITSYDWNRIALTTKADADAMLVGLDRFDPSWHVYVDGKEVPLWKANGMLRASHVRKGSHEVVLQLQGKGRMPMIVTVLGWVAMAVCGVAAARRSTRKS